MRYEQPSSIGGLRGITPGVKFLIGLNVAVYAGEAFFGVPLRHIFALNSDWYHTLSFGQLFTYMFIHANFSHLAMNMLTLFFIGPVVESTLGTYRFFLLYYLSGILGGLGWSLLAPPYAACLGASGAIFGVLGAFGALYPDATLLLWFVLPIKAWVLVLGLGLIELYQTVFHPLMGGIANAAHLMGGLAGFVYAMTLRRPHFLRETMGRMASSARRKPRAPRNSASPSGLSPEEIDHILDKIGKQGMGALTPREREMLKRATRG